MILLITHNFPALPSALQFAMLDFPPVDKPFSELPAELQYAFIRHSCSGNDAQTEDNNIDPSGIYTRSIENVS